MKRVKKAFVLPYNFWGYFLTIAAFAGSVLFAVVFFISLSEMPDTVPVHWTAGVGYDRWGQKSELYHLGIIPLVFAMICSPTSLFILKKGYQGFSYFLNGILLYMLFMCAIASFLMLNY